MNAGRKIAQGIAGLVAGLALAEAVFYIRDDGAFPHVAFYRADATLGARLAPHASQRIAFGGNPTTTITTNSLGYRGAEWPARKEGGREVLVVGDSQVYGLGVEDDATFASVLAATAPGIPAPAEPGRLSGGIALAKPTASHPGTVVLNGGVPTYGPFEYAAVVDEVIALRRPSHVVFVVNLANDLFEATRKNTERHAIWDGWAVRSETMPEDFIDFPGRTLLFSRSHLVFALRSLLTPTLPPGDDRGFPSEGGWTDLATTAQQARPPQPDPGNQARNPIAAARWDARRTLDDLDRRLDAETKRLLRVDVASAIEAEGERIAAPRGAAHDIVVSKYAESGREVGETASILLAGARVRHKHERALRELATRTSNQALLTLLDARQASALKLDELARPGAANGAPSMASPVGAVLERVKRSCDAVGARLIVVALPLDVMVSAEEWSKYDVTTPIDMSDTNVLIEDILADAKAVGAVGLDAMMALSAAEPGAFLDKDLHMSAKGHAALAAALLPKLDELPPLPRPRSGLPPGRSLLPTSDEWARVLESDVTGSSAAACETKRVREWLRVSCHGTDALVPTGVNIEERVVDAVALSGGTSAVLITPVVQGTRVAARFLWRDHSRTLVAAWPTDQAAPTIAFGARQAKAALDEEGKRFREPATDGLCKSHYDYTNTAARRVVNCDLMNGLVIDQEIGGPRVISFDHDVSVVCGEDEVRAGALPTCAKRCAAERPCAKGVCEPWMGAHVCR